MPTMTTDEIKIIDDLTDIMLSDERMLKRVVGTHMESAAKEMLLESIKDLNNALEGQVTERTLQEKRNIDYTRYVIRGLAPSEGINLDPSRYVTNLNDK